MKASTSGENNQLTEDQLKRKFRKLFSDPNFFSMERGIDQLSDIGWNNYKAARKSPETRKNNTK
jgi:hypothetical protein